eukprot:TRINITY_DN8543_c0_g1_i21.p1 TRINITY_DN8543_c0_g1~~TRINITY_DN8543_c0_g1_i21.p1  ORF type:complete len:182 (+),score=40.45 TRINITY_DN8543_c0_g1_i21:925-1470(+)
MFQNSSYVWVKKEGEPDEKAEKIHIALGSCVSDLKDALYESKKFAFTPGTIDCIVEGNQELPNRDPLSTDTTRTYTVHLKQVTLPTDEMKDLKRKFEVLEQESQREIQELKESNQELKGTVNKLANEVEVETTNFCGAFSTFVRLSKSQELDKPFELDSHPLDRPWKRMKVEKQVGIVFSL